MIKIDYWVLAISIGTLIITTLNILYSIYSTEKARNIELSYSERREQFEELVKIISDVSSMIRLYPYSTTGEELVKLESRILATKPLFYSYVDYKNKYANELRTQFNAMVTISLDGITANGETNLKDIAEKHPNVFESILLQDKRIIHLYQILDLYTDEYRKSIERMK